MLSHYDGSGTGYVCVGGGGGMELQEADGASTVLTLSKEGGVHGISDDLRHSHFKGYSIYPARHSHECDHETPSRPFLYTSAFK
jgi:hypothetical protein